MDVPVFLRSAYIHSPTPREFPVIKKTPAGFIISTWRGPVFVLSGDGKRFAYPTKETALASYIACKKRQVKILTAQLDRAKTNLETATKRQGASP